MYVNDSSEQVVEGLAILRYPVGLRKRGLITQKTLFRHAFAQFSRYRVETLPLRQWLTEQVVEGLAILRCSVGHRNYGLITQKL